MNCEETDISIFPDINTIDSKLEGVFGTPLVVRKYVENVVKRPTTTDHLNVTAWLVE